MKKLASYILYTLLLSAVVCACSNDLDVHQAYSFDLVTMPVQKKIVLGESAEIRCQIIKEGEFQDTKFYIRYFQPDGKGELKMDDGTVFSPNDIYPLDRMVFRLYYTSHTANQQVIDIYIEDSFGQVVQKTFAFQNERVEDEDLPTETE